MKIRTRFISQVLAIRAILGPYGTLFEAFTSMSDSIYSSGVMNPLFGHEPDYVSWRFTIVNNLSHSPCWFNLLQVFDFLIARKWINKIKSKHILIISERENIFSVQEKLTITTDAVHR